MALTGTVTNVGNDVTDLPPEQLAGAVLYIPQSLSDSQKAQVLANIGAPSKSETNHFVSEVTFNSETGELTFVSANDSTTFELPLYSAVTDVEIVENKIAVTFNDTSKNKLIELPANSSAIIVNDILPDRDGHIRLGILDIPDLAGELNARVTNTDLAMVRGLKIISDELAQTLTIVDAEDVELHTFSVDWLSNANVLKTPKSEVFRLSEEQVNAGDTIELNLMENPSQHDFVMVFCNGTLLNADGIFLKESQIVILKNKVDYSFKSGMKITVNYKY